MLLKVRNKKGHEVNFTKPFEARDKNLCRHA
jgi:hypothetical protein